jgi:hypothetical protein
VVELLASRALFVGVSEPWDAGAYGDHGEGETGAANTTEVASLASGLVALAVVPPVVTPSAELHVERQIILPFMECSTRYTVL